MVSNARVRHAIANTTLGVVTIFMMLSSVLHYFGAWQSQFLPMSDTHTYDNTGARYDINRILTPDFTLDEEAYKNYSPLFIRSVFATRSRSLTLTSCSTTFALAYGASFAAISSLIVYTYLHNGKTIWKQYRNSSNEKPDIHMKLMRKYKEAPTWWYMSLFSVVSVRLRSGRLVLIKLTM